MRIDILCNHVFASSLPDDELAIHQYGSEVQAAVLSKALHDAGHEIHMYAPVGSSRIGYYSPIRRTDGKYIQPDTLDNLSLDGSKTIDLLQSDCVIDMTPFANTVEELALYYDRYNYISYRLGFKDYMAPRLEPHLRHYVTHCDWFARLFEQAGYPNTQVCHFGISSFWSPDPNPMRAFDDITNNWQILPNQLKSKEYYLFPHRFSKEKGSFDVIRLAKEFPDRTFVFSSAAVSPDHVQSLQQLRQIAPPNCVFVSIPSAPDREFYRRELYRNAIATLSPFHNMNDYEDTGGILSMESIKCGTPVIVTRSPGSEEILGHQQDRGATFIDGYESLKMAIKYVDFLSLHPTPWCWTVENYRNEYIKAIKNIIE